MEEEGERKWGEGTLSVPFHSLQKMVTALGTHWHPEHFCCVSCGEPFGDEGESLTPILKAAGPLDIPPRSLWARPLDFRNPRGPDFSPALSWTRPIPPADSHPTRSRSAPNPDPVPLHRLRPLTAPLPAPQSQIFVGSRGHLAPFFLLTLFPLLGFHEREGRPYCRRDFLHLFAPRCQGCQGPILDNYISALSALWHPDCFVCRVRDLWGAGPWREGPVGAGLGVGAGLIFGAGSRGGGASFSLEMRGAAGVSGGYSVPKEDFLVWRLALTHPFVVAFPQECFAPFSGGSFFEHEGRPLCENHFHARRGSLCATCGLPVTGRCVSALGRRFHPDHFTCTFCLRPLTKGSFQERAGKPYCQPCFLKLFG